MAKKRETESDQLRKFLLHLEMEKSDERLEFEKEYKCWFYATREENRYGYHIHSVYGGYDYEEPEKFSSNISVMKLMARFNMGHVRFIWLPREFGEITPGWMEENKSLLDKYSEKI